MTNPKTAKKEKGDFVAMHHRKAQAALEFLTTYGWAFLVILIMISALAYFGILNPSKILPNRCNFGPEFECLDWQISVTDTSLKLKMRNNVGEPIVVSAINVTSQTTTALSCTAPTNIGSNSTWGTSEVRDITLSSCNLASVGFQKGEKEKIFVNMKYYAVKSGSGYVHETNGEVFSSVI